jgi:hypothetical protein
MAQLSRMVLAKEQILHKEGWFLDASDNGGVGGHDINH